MLRSVLVAILLPAVLGYSTPRSQCSDSKSATCPSGHLFLTSFKSVPSTCAPPKAGSGCSVQCSIVQKQAWMGKEECKHTVEFAHVGQQQPVCWHWAYPNCAGSRQSPINIVTADTVRSRQRPIVIRVGRNSKNPILTISPYENNGHAIKASLTAASSKATRVTGGPLRGVYQIAQFHFHFNSKGKGSEHTINGKSYDAEMHIVTFNKKYGCFAVAKEYCDGLAVIGVMLSTSEFTLMRNALNNPPAASQRHLNNFFFYVSRHLKFCGEKLNGPYSMPIKRFLPRGFQSNYYTYQGSLTTPPCSESVRWIVLKNGLHMNAAEFKEMEHVMTGSAAHPGHEMNGNRRPTQPLHGRKVYSV